MIKTIKRINKYAKEDSIQMISPGTQSTPEQSGIEKGFWHTFYFIFYGLQLISGNLKKDEKHE